MNSAPFLSVVIVNYNGGALLQRTLQSLYDTTDGLALETFVVDNGSSDGSLEMVQREFPTAQVIESDANLGFAKANNRALRRARILLPFLVFILSRNPCLFFRFRL